MEKRSTATIDTRYTELPDGFLDPMRFHLGVDQQNIELTSSSELQKYRNESSDVAGRPKLYAITGGQIEVWPSPDTSYTGELYYYAKINSLSDAVSTNWVLQYYPDAYLYGSLIHSAPYLSDDQRTTVWAALYKSATDGINSNNDKAKFGGNLRLRVKSY
jgi:hypothetical protein